MADPNTDVAAPVMKAASALAAGAGTSAMAMSQKAQAFLPTDLGGWLAAGASGVALLYTLHLMGEWYWKKFWRPLLERWGMLKAAPPKRVVVIEDASGDIEVST